MLSDRLDQGMVDTGHAARSIARRVGSGQRHHDRACHTNRSDVDVGCNRRQGYVLDADRVADRASTLVEGELDRARPVRITRRNFLGAGHRSGQRPTAGQRGRGQNQAEGYRHGKGAEAQRMARQTHGSSKSARWGALRDRYAAVRPSHGNLASQSVFGNRCL
jgi:hypothetical protein